MDPQTGEVFNVRDIPEQEFVAGDYNDSLNARPKPVNELDDGEFKNVLRKLDGNLCKRSDTLEKCIERFNLPSSDANFKGLSGITGRAFLETAEGGKNPSGKREVFVRGKILDKCLHDTSLAGYHYDRNTFELRLCVIMITEIARPRAPNNKFQYQYFHVEASSAYVDQKNPGDPENVFKKAAKATGLKVTAATANGFEFKLYAAGKNIEVINYWEAKASKKQGNPKWKKYVKGQTGIPRRIREYFKIDHDACVDMMFPMGLGVPETLPSGSAAGVHYCLGRCKNPPIVNTR